MISAHIFLDGDLRARLIMKAAPRTGETIRLAGDVYGTVTEIVWCLDEPNIHGQRVNIRAESEGKQEPSHDNQ